MNRPSRLNPEPVGVEPGPAESEGGARHPTAAAVERATGIHFRNPGLVVRALTHSSYANESPREGEDYERLEFLGDAVLDFLAAYWLFHHYPGLPEGDLTRLRSALVRTETLASYSRRLGLETIIRIGKGERASGGQNRTTILCGVFEALVGAIALDQDTEAAFAFVSPFFQEEAALVPQQEDVVDSKSLFQEEAQARFGITPAYRVVDMSGPDHDRRYRVEVLVGDEAWGRGDGNSKQSAEQVAAREALAKLRSIKK